VTAIRCTAGCEGGALIKPLSFRLPRCNSALPALCPGFRQVAVDWALLESPGAWSEAFQSRFRARAFRRRSIVFRADTRRNPSRSPLSFLAESSLRSASRELISRRFVPLRATPLWTGSVRSVAILPRHPRLKGVVMRRTTARWGWETG